VNDSVENDTLEAMIHFVDSNYCSIEVRVVEQYEDWLGDAELLARYDADKAL